MALALHIVYIIVAVFIIVVVLFQSGKQQGLSGSIAGGAETFFGKSKGRTADAILSKLTTISAVLFIIIAMVLLVMGT